MTKKEIYEQVVHLTDELAQTKVAEKIFKAAKEGDALKTQMIIDAFPEYYPELNQKIVSFGEKFNKLVGDSEEDNAKFKEIREQCEFVMSGLARTKVIEKIAEATDVGDATKLQEVISNFKQEYPDFAGNLMNFQQEYNKYFDNHQTGHEGEIFGTETNEEKGVFAFDTNIIDALSFYVFIILTNISDVYFFCDEEVEEDGEKCCWTANDNFVDALEEATNEAFAIFVLNYNLVDWVGKDEEYQSVGEILVAALAGEFEHQDDEESEGSEE